MAIRYVIIVADYGNASGLRCAHHLRAQNPNGTKLAITDGIPNLPKYCFLGPGISQIIATDGVHDYIVTACRR
jgi:hypothetical protein